MLLFVHAQTSLLSGGRLPLPLFSHRLVKDLLMMNDYGQVKQVISALERDFTVSSNPNSRKGGLVGLAATAIALGRVSIKSGTSRRREGMLLTFIASYPGGWYHTCDTRGGVKKT